MKLCDTCIYRNNVEQLKPCIIYRDDCEYYEKERGDMTREEAIKELQESHDIMRSYDIDESESRLMTALDMAIKALEQEPKTGHWEQYGNSWEDKFKCSECGKEQPKILCGERIIGHWSDYCPNCGCRMVEPQESEESDAGSN